MAGTISRRHVLGGLGALGVGALFGGRLGAAELPGKRPNIVFIMSDDHAAHAISCYGSRINKTPNIDRIAREGVRLDNCLCTNAICGPSRACILTGKYSHMNGFLDNNDTFDGSQQTFPKMLQNAGYKTAMVGKWHLVSDPTGFDYWNILPGQGEYVDPMMIENGKKVKRTGYVTDLITDTAIELIQKRDEDAPFCLMCHHKAPHRNWIPDARHADMYEKDDIPEPDTFKDDYANRSKAAAEAEMRVNRDLTPTDLKQEPPPGLEGDALAHWKYERYIKDYLRVVASVDDNVGRLLDFLDKEGLAENTLVVYTSDQGFFLGDHGWFDKRFMYDESLRMPFVARFPGVIAPGTVNRDMALNVDFAPTFLDLAGVKAPGDMQGRSFLPVLRGETPPDWRAAMYYQYYEFPQPHHVYPHYGVCTDRYKLIHYYLPGKIDEWELIDREKDPRELRSVYEDPEYGDVVKKLKKQIAAFRKALNVPGNAA
jgi:arylsulfatase A-like enzyme